MSCTIYLVRHGIAAAAMAGEVDAERALTTEGQRKVARIARGLKRLGVRPDLVLSSPLLRAEETARLLVAGTAPSLSVELFEELAPGGSPSQVLTGLAAYRGRRGIMLVGHEPSMGYLAAQLLTGTTTLAALPFKKGAVAAFRLSSLPPSSPAALLWFLTPRQLRLIGRG